MNVTSFMSFKDLLDIDYEWRTNVSHIQDSNHVTYNTSKPYVMTREKKDELLI